MSELGVVNKSGTGAQIPVGRNRIKGALDFWSAWNLSARFGNSPGLVMGLLFR